MIPQKVCICTISVIKCLHFDLMLKSLRGEIYNYRFFSPEEKKTPESLYIFQNSISKSIIGIFPPNLLDFRIFKIYVTITTILS